MVGYLAKKEHVYLPGKRVVEKMIKLESTFLLESHHGASLHSGPMRSQTDVFCEGAIGEGAKIQGLFGRNRENSFFTKEEGALY